MSWKKFAYLATAAAAFAASAMLPTSAAQQGLLFVGGLLAGKELMLQSEQKNKK